MDALTEPIPPNEPQFIGPYEVKGLFKKGGMSEIYFALHPKTFEMVLIKILKANLLKNKELSLKEAKVLQKAAHPNIVKIHELGSYADGLYIVMEYVQGISLRQFIRSQSLTHKKALQIVLQIAYALAHLHSQGIIHNDLKPENILLTESGDIKLIDFGIAQFAETLNLPQGGTPHYMSPERKKASLAISYSSDIFSLALLAYELYLGHPAKGAIQTSLLPKGLDQIFIKSLQTDPKKRYTKVLDFISDLSQYLQMEDSLSTAPFYFDLIATKAPKWNQMEMGIGIKTGEMSGAYLDFFSFDPNRFGIFYAKSTLPGQEGLFHAAMLKGMAQLESQHVSSTIPSFLNSLNQVLSHPFHFTLLFFDVEHTLFAFATSEKGNCYHLPNGGLLITENPLLGKSKTSQFVEVKERWQPEDLILFSSYPIENKPAKELLLLDPKNLAKEMEKEISPSNFEEVILTIKHL